MKQVNIRKICLLLCVATVVLLTGCGAGEPEKKSDSDGIRIGFSFDSLVIERWQRDRDVFVSRAQELGATVNVQNAGGDVAAQKKQISYFIEQKMDVIVVVAADTAALSDVVAQAKERGIRVVAYDRMLENANVDLYLSFDSEKVGEIYGDAITRKFPKGAQILEVLGSSEDYNVKLMEKGLASKLGSTYKVVEKNYAKGWIAEAYANGIAYSDADARDYVASVADKDLLEKTFVDYFLSRHKYVKDFYHQEDILDQAEKINIYFDDMENSRELREKWKDLDDVAVTTSISGNAEFNAAGVDKGVGLAMLRTKLGIDRMHVIAFGDNENDLEMLEGAGIGVAMGNSKQYVKDAANEVTGDNDHDGVAEFLERFFGL